MPLGLNKRLQETASFCIRQCSCLAIRHTYVILVTAVREIYARCVKYLWIWFFFISNLFILRLPGIWSIYVSPLIPKSPVTTSNGFIFRCHVLLNYISIFLYLLRLKIDLLSTKAATFIRRRVFSTINSGWFFWVFLSFRTLKFQRMIYTSDSACSQQYFLWGGLNPRHIDQCMYWATLSYRCKYYVGATYYYYHLTLCKMYYHNKELMTFVATSCFIRPKYIQILSFP